MGGAILKGPGHVWISLKTDAPRVLRRQVRLAWAEFVPRKVAHRQGLANLPPLSLEDFHHVTMAFDPPLLKNLGLLFFGGFQSKAAQSQWDPFEDASCRCCGASDTKHHRLFLCPAQAAVRKPFQPVLQWVLNEVPFWTYCAVPAAHPDESVLRLIFQTRKVVPSPPPLGLVLRYRLPYCHFYTDGTCAHPVITPARHAAWAVVLDCAPNLPPPLLMQHWVEHKKAPPSFHVITQGLLPGHQSIDRAEVLALLQVCIMAANMPRVLCIGFTDSQFALDLVQGWDAALWCRNAGAPMIHQDLFEALAVQRKPPNLELRKVKAHNTVAMASDSDLRYVLGNVVADAAAKHARLSDLSVVIDLAKEINDWHEWQREGMKMFCQYNVELTRAVATLDKATTTAPDGASAHERDDTELVEAWLQRSVGEIVAQPPLQLPETWPTDSSWPQWFLAALWVWQDGLQWPPALNRRLHRGEGITFLELLVNFVVTTTKLPPIAGDSDGLCDPLSAQGILLPLVQRDLLSAFVSALDFLGRRVGVKVWGVPKHHRIFTLTALGDANPRKGVQQRPRMQHERTTATLIIRLLKCGNCAEILREWALAAQSC